jgi:hypothetical protein
MVALMLRQLLLLQLLLVEIVLPCIPRLCSVVGVVGSVGGVGGVGGGGGGGGGRGGVCGGGGEGGRGGVEGGGKVEVVLVVGVEGVLVLAREELLDGLFLGEGRGRVAVVAAVGGGKVFLVAIVAVAAVGSGEHAVADERVEVVEVAHGGEQCIAMYRGVGVEERE